MSLVGLGRGSSAVRRASGSGPNPGKQSVYSGTSVVPASLEQLNEYLYSLTPDNFKQFGEKFGLMTLSFLTSRPKETTAAASMVLEAAIDSKETTRLGAMVCKAIMYPPESSPEQYASISENFRTKLVGLLQKKYDDKAKIRSRSIEAWLGIFSLLCELYRCFHSMKGWGFTGKVIIEASRFILNNDDCVDDEVECVCLHLKDIGIVLEEGDPTGVETIVSELRTRVISRRSSEKVRCLCLELIEYRARGYHDNDKGLSNYYLVALQDAIANDETQY